MEKYPLEIVIPIYNEGEKVINLLIQFQNIIKTKFKVLLCYDLDDDDIFLYKDKLKIFLDSLPKPEGEPDKTKDAPATKMPTNAPKPEGENK